MVKEGKPSKKVVSKEEIMESWKGKTGGRGSVLRKKQVTKCGEEERKVKENHRGEKESRENQRDLKRRQRKRSVSKKAKNKKNRRSIN